MPLPRARAKYGYHLWLFSNAPSSGLCWSLDLTQGPISDESINHSLFVHFHAEAACSVLLSGWESLQLPSTYYFLQISEESLSLLKHLTALLSRSFLSCPPATKLSHFARYGFEGSRPGRSIIAIELLRRLNTPNQPTFENGHVTTFRNCHYKAWHSHRLGQTSLARRIHRSIVWNCFQLDKHSPALALSHKARALSMGTIWSSQHRTLHQQRISRVTGPQPAIKLAERRSCSPSLRATTARAHPQGRSDENNTTTTFRNDLPIHFLHWEVSPVRWHLEQAGSEFCSCVHLSPRRFGLVASTKCKNCEQQIFSNPTARDNVACPDWLWRKTWAIIGCNTSR